MSAARGGIVVILDRKHDFFHPRVGRGIEHHDKLAMRRIAGPFNEQALTLVLLGALAGVPTVLGAWIGGFTYSPAWTAFFFAVGAGAIAQVVYEVGRLFARRAGAGLLAPINAAGLVLGMVVMYGTGLLVSA